MNFSLIFVCLILCVTQTQSQDECRGTVSPADPNCYAERSEGHTYRPSCLRNTNKEMWYFDAVSGSCKKLYYKGCGGNKNRFCSREACSKECRRL